MTFPFKLISEALTGIYRLDMGNADTLTAWQIVPHLLMTWEGTAVSLICLHVLN